MDIRITHTCNNDCIYCLESSLRKRKKFLDIWDIISQLKTHKKCHPQDDVLNFYWGNPLLHPDLQILISQGRELNFRNISLLTNTQGITPELIVSLQASWLTGIGFYFHSFSETKHEIVVQSGFSLSQLQYNIQLLSTQSIYCKCIIHVNLQNIETLYKDITKLYFQYNISDFELIRYRLLGRAKKDYSNFLMVPYEVEKKYIWYVRKLLAKLPININFIHFEA